MIPKKIASFSKKIAAVLINIACILKKIKIASGAPLEIASYQGPKVSEISWVTSYFLRLADFHALGTGAVGTVFQEPKPDPHHPLKLH